MSFILVDCFDNFKMKHFEKNGFILNGNYVNLTTYVDTFKQQEKKEHTKRHFFLQNIFTVNEPKINGETRRTR